MKSKLLIITLFIMSFAGIATAQNQHDYVDLGLPSGTLWATCNVGANNPEDYGDYFAWGETSPKELYDWSTYKYAKGEYNALTKYSTISSFDGNYGYNYYIDSLIILEQSDDVAFQKWGSDWNMPSRLQFQELNDICTWTWTTQKGKHGYKVKGPNGNSIFLPAGGGYCSFGMIDVGTVGYYWSSSLNTGNPCSSIGLVFCSNQVTPNNWNYRNSGVSVRPVRSKK